MKKPRRSDVEVRAVDTKHLRCVVQDLHARPVIAGVSTLRNLAHRRVMADWTPDLCLELAGRNVVAGKIVVLCSQYLTIT